MLVEQYHTASSAKSGNEKPSKNTKTDAMALLFFRKINCAKKTKSAETTSQHLTVHKTFPF